MSCECIAKKFAAIQLHVVTAGDKDARGLRFLAHKKRDSPGYGGADSRSQQTHVVTVSIGKSAADEAEIILDHHLDCQACGVIAGQFLAKLLPLFGRSLAVCLQPLDGARHFVATS